MSDPTFPASELDPTLARIGVLSGLLTEAGGGDDLELNTGWFGDPLASLRAIPSDPTRSTQLFALIEELLGTLSGEALGAPIQESGRTWYPIPRPSDGGQAAETGLYLVTRDEAAGGGGASTTVVGLGALHEFSSGPVRVRPYLYSPILEMPSRNGVFVLGHDGYPVELGVEVTGGTGGFGTGEISFDGLKVFATVDFTGTAPDLDIVLLNLKLPGQAARDTSIHDLENTPVDEWVSTGIYVLLSQICAIAPADRAEEYRAMADALAAILGLVGGVPGIDWAALVAKPAQAGQTLGGWLAAIAGSPASLAAWLADWYALFHGVDPATAAAAITGSGTRADPFVVPVLEAKTARIDVALTVAAEVDATSHALRLYPGLRIASPPVAPISGAPDTTVDVRIEAELLELVLPPDGNPPAPVPFPSLDLLVVMSDPTALFGGSTYTEFEAAAEDALIAIGSIRVGAAYRKPEGGGARGVYPTVSLTDVRTPVGSWDTVDLTNFDEVTRDIEEAIAGLVQKALDAFLDTTGGETAGRVARSLAAVLGVTPPPGYTPQTWPVQDLLLSGKGLQQVIDDPLAALGAYYARCLDTPAKGAGDDAPPAWSLLLPSFASLLGDVAIGQGTVTGAGTFEDPWRVPLTTGDAGSPTALLRSWAAPPAGAGSGPELRLAAELLVPLPAGSLTPSFSVHVDLLTLRLPTADGAGQWGADWFGAAAARLQVDGPEKDGKPQPLTTPDLGGVQLRSDGAGVSLGWLRGQAFYASAEVRAVAVLSGGQVVDEIGDIEFSFTPTEWDTADLDKAARLTVDVVGAWLLGHGGATGVLAATGLGLLPSLPAVFAKPGDYPFPLPDGLTLPENWPVLATKGAGAAFLADPWPAVRAQLGAVLGSADCAVPFMRLVGWAVTGTLPPAPPSTPAGTRDDPWWVELPDVWEVRPLLWTAPGGAGRVGVGAARTMAVATGAGLRLAVEMRVDAAEFAVGPPARSAGTDAAGIPCVSLLCVVSAAGGGAIELPDGSSIGEARFGAVVDGTGIRPVVRIGGASVHGGPTLDLDLETALDADASQQALELLLYGLMLALSRAQGSVPLVGDTLRILYDLGLLSRQGTGTAATYTVVLGAWRSLLADPTAFLTGRMEAVLEDPEACTALFDDLARLLGFPSFALPASLAGLPPVLVAFQLMDRHPGGLAPSLSAWLSLVQDPVGYVRAQGERLLSAEGADARKELVTALSALPRPQPPLDRLPLTFEDGSRLTLRIPPDRPIGLGDDLRLDASLVLNLQALTLAGEVALASRTANLALTLDAQVDLALGAGASPPAWTLALVGAAPDVPAPFDPLVFYPLPDQAAVEAYLKQVAEQAPVFLVSALGAWLLNDFVLPRYPLVGRVARDLGVATDGANGTPRITSLVSLFRDPVAWVLGDHALGDGAGKLDLGRVGTLLHDLPGGGMDGPDGIRLEPAGDDGLALTGLPFGAAFSLAADTAAGVQLGATLKPALPAPAPAVDVSATLAFGAAAGLVVTGDAALEFDLTPAQGKHSSLTVDAAYAAIGFGLKLKGSYQGTAFPSGEADWIWFVPFKGLNQFLDSGVETALARLVSDQLIALCQRYEKGPPAPDPHVVALVHAVAQLLEYFDVQDVDDLLDVLKQIAADPVEWLLAWFQQPKLPTTLKQIDSLLSGPLGLPGFTVKDSLLTYAPPIPSDFGALVVGLGQQVEDGPFGVWVDPTVTVGWVRLAASIGVGFETLSKSPEIAASLDAALGVAAEAVPVPGLAGGPELRLGLADDAGALSANLRAYPVGFGATADTLVIGLLPHPVLAYGDDPDKAVPALEWVERFIVDYLVPLVADMVLAQPRVATWLDAPLLADHPKSPAPGALLAEWGLLKKADGSTLVGGDPTRYILADVARVFGEMGPLKTVEKLFFVLLEGLDGFELLAVAGGGIYVASRAAGDGKDLGLRVQIPDLLLVGGKPASTRALTLQLGKWLSHAPDDGAANWIAASEKGWTGEPGVAFYFIRSDGKGAFDFHGGFDLTSVGVDFTGANGKPLASVAGLTLGGIEPRIYLALDAADPAAFSLGAGLQFDALGIPLGPKVGTGGNSNPVAQSLLSSGDDADQPGQAVNPSFSAALGKVHVPDTSTAFYVDLFAGPGTAKDEKGVLWIPVQRSFGPIACRRVGFGWEGTDKLLEVGFDGTVSLAALAISLMDLEVGIPVTAPLDFTDYRLDLAGLDVAWSGGPIEINGGLLKSGVNPVTYTGQAMIVAEAFGVAAMASYAQIDKYSPSLFVFALLDMPLGGPPYFFVTGLAGGFGYNRGLKLPDQDGVAAFPLVGGVLDPQRYFPGGNDPGAALAALNADVPIKRGQYWLAAGIKFTSFEMLNSFALLTVSFGTEFEVALLGLTVIELPAGLPGDVAIARAELQLMVDFKPSAGLLAATASLTPNSYVLDRSCRLTGGFAFYVWFGASEHAGQFVVTLGGYHPRFKAPDYFPVEPRLGFNWKVSDEVVIKGGCYFALTPSAVMAGGGLQVLFQAGKLKAWFTAVADFLIQWKPFWYDIQVGVSVGASYRVDALFVHKTFTVELSADLVLTGPPLHGRARVSWWVISFTVSFGARNHEPQPLDWGDFDRSFLPSSDPDQASRLSAAAGGLARDPRCLARVSKGLVGDRRDEKTGVVQRWLVNPQSLVIETECVVPSTAVHLNDQPVAGITAPAMGIVPMSRTGLASTHGLGVTKQMADGTWAPVPAADLRIDAVSRAVPRALWDPGKPDPLGSDTTLPGAPVGVRIVAPEIPYDSIVPIPIDRLEFEQDEPRDFEWGDVQPPDSPVYPQTRTIQREMETLMAPDVAALRARLATALAAAGVPVSTEMGLGLLADTADEVFLAPPVLVPLGGYPLAGAGQL